MTVIPERLPDIESLQLAKGAHPDGQVVTAVDAQAVWDAAIDAAEAALVASGTTYSLVDRRHVANIVLRYFGRGGYSGSGGEVALIEVVADSDPTFARLCTLWCPYLFDAVQLMRSGREREVYAVAQGAEATE